MKEGQKFLRKDITGESVSLKATAEVDTPLLQALTDESEGLLKAGALPQLQIATTGGNKILLDSVEKVGFLGMSPFHLVRWLPPRKKQKPRRRQKMTSLQRKLNQRLGPKRQVGYLHQSWLGLQLPEQLQLSLETWSMHPSLRKSC